MQQTPWMFFYSHALIKEGVYADRNSARKDLKDQSPYRPMADSRYGDKLYLCVDDSLNVWGTYSESGVYWGITVPEQNFAEGRWYQAGNSACNSGYWEATYLDNNPNSLFFTVTCDFNAQQTYNYTETRFNHIANDDQCNVVYDHSNIEPLSGTWSNIKQDIEYIDFCIFDDDDESHASLSRTGVNATQGYMTGQVMENDRLFQGDYSLRTNDELYQSGGVLFFPRTNSQAVMFTWPGPKIVIGGIHNVNTVSKRDSDPSLCEINRDIVLRSSYEFTSDASRVCISFIIVCLTIFAYL